MDQNQNDLPAASLSRGRDDSENRYQDRIKRPNTNTKAQTQAQTQTQAASKAQMEEIRLSLTRQVPGLLPRHVPGSLVLTAEERARAVQKTSLSNAPRRKATTDLRKAATSRASQARISPPGPERVLDYLFDSPDTCQLLAATAAPGDGALNAPRAARRPCQASRTEDAGGYYQEVSASASVSGDIHGDGNRDEPVEAPEPRSRDKPGTPDHSKVEHHTSPRGAMNLPAPQACSAELRKALDSTFSDYLRADNRSSTPVKRKRSMSKFGCLT